MHSIQAFGRALAECMDWKCALFMHRDSPAANEHKAKRHSDGLTMIVQLRKNIVDMDWFNPNPEFLPYSLRISCFAEAMQDIYDFLFNVNKLLLEHGLQRLDDMLRPAAMSGIISDMLTARLAHHTLSLCENKYFNGHPDLIVKGVYPNDSVPAGREGIEIKSTSKKGGAVDTHGARDQNMCVFVYELDTKTEPAIDRSPLAFTEVYLGPVTVEDFRTNGRGPLGTRTATLNKDGLAKLRRYWLYRKPTIRS